SGTDHDTHELRLARLGADRHEVDEGHRALVGFELGFQDQGLAPVLPPVSESRAYRSYTPSSMIRRTQKRGEASSRVKARPAQPVDGAVSAHKPRGFAIA